MYPYETGIPRNNDLHGGFCAGTTRQIQAPPAADRYDLPGIAAEQKIRSSIAVAADTPLFLISAQEKTGARCAPESTVRHGTQVSY